MGNIDVYVVNLMTGEEYEVAVPDEKKVEEWIQVLTQKMEAGAPREGSAWR